MKTSGIKRAILIAFVGAIFTALQFLALLLTLDMVVSGNKTSVGLITGILLISVIGRLICFYFSSIDETDTGYFMVAGKKDPYRRPSPLYSDGIFK